MTATTQPTTTADVAATVGRQIGLARASQNNGDLNGQKNHAEAALESLQSIELNYDNLDWRQLAEGDAQMLLGNFPAAEKAYRQAMIAAPQQSGGYQRLAELLITMERGDDLKKHMDMCMQKFPNDSAFLKMQAVAAAANDDYEIAIPALAKAFAMNQNDHQVADALGSCLQNIQHYDEAVLYHAHALELQPTNAAYAVRYGLAFLGVGENEAALELFRIALNLRPDFIDAYAYLGYELQNRGEIDEARKTFEEGLARDPEHPNLNFYYGRLMQELDEKDAALKHFGKTVAAQGKEADTAEFLSASLKGESPDQPPEKFIRGLFDFYAPSFETALVKNLQYRAPAAILQALQNPAVTAVRNIQTSKQRILDLGCGTGLMGLVLKPHAEKLVGVDLSHNMLIRANEKGIYDETRRQDIVIYINEMAQGAFDLVVAADVFIYIGNLQPIFSALTGKLTAGSLVAFSCEKLPEDTQDNGYKLRSTVRYAQKDSYIRKLAADYGFDVLYMDASPVRQQAGQPIDGLHYILAKR
jgi:predicted TPR repeat methyltransferase